MHGKRGAAKGVALAKQKTSPKKVLEKLPDNPTSDELRDAAVHISLADLEERVADVRDSWETESLFEDAFEELVNDDASASVSGKLMCCFSCRPSSLSMSSLADSCFLLRRCQCRHQRCQ